MAGRDLAKLRHCLDQIQVSGKLKDIPLLLASPSDLRFPLILE